FSLDSVITAVGMVDELSVMMIAVIIAIAVMMISSKPLMAFVSKHPTVAAIENVGAWLQDYAWGEQLLQRITPGALMSDGAGGTATTAVTTTFGALGNFVIMIFIGLYVALDPQP